jgi:hypothetical protein
LPSSDTYFQYVNYLKEALAPKLNNIMNLIGTTPTTHHDRQLSYKGIM